MNVPENNLVLRELRIFTSADEYAELFALENGLVWVFYTCDEFDSSFDFSIVLFFKVVLLVVEYLEACVACHVKLLKRWAESTLVDLSDQVRVYHYLN